MDYGLLGGIGEGLQAGVQSYGQAQDRKMRQDQMAQERKAKQQQLDLEMTEKGLIPKEHGGFEKSPELKAKEATDKQRKEQEFKLNRRKELHSQGLMPVEDELGNEVSTRNMTPEEIEQERKLKAPYEKPLSALEQQKIQSEIAKNYAETKNKGKLATDGTRLPADKVLTVQAGQQIPKQLDDIEQTIANNQDQFGPVKGLIGGMNPYNQKTQTIDAQVRTAAQNFGRFMEGGVLRKEDELKYMKMFPQLRDTPEVAQNKLMLIRKALEEKNVADVAALQRSGYDTTAFNEIPQGKRDLPTILGKTPQSSGLIPEAQAAPKAPQKGEIKNGYKFIGGDPSNPQSWEKQ